MNIVVKGQKHNAFDNADSNDLSAHVDEIVGHAPSFTDKQIDAVAEALEIKEAA